MDATKTARSIVTSSPSVIKSVQPKGKTLSPLDDYRHATGSFSNLIDAIGACMKYKSAYCDFECMQDQLSSMILQLNQATTERDTAEKCYVSAAEESELRVNARTIERERLKLENTELIEQLAKERQHREDIQSTNIKPANDKKEMESSIRNWRADLAQQREKAERALHRAKDDGRHSTTDKKEKSLTNLANLQQPQPPMKTHHQSAFPPLETPFPCKIRLANKTVYSRFPTKTFAAFHPLRPLHEIPS